jgi:hypothetical protein
MTTLPKMGRPSLSGLSIKGLGSAEYNRQLRKIKNAGKPRKKPWSGIPSSKIIGQAAYMKAWRRMRITERSQIQSSDIPKSQTNDP